MKLTDQQIRKAQQEQPWDVGNEMLYKMCSNHQGHTDEKWTITKVLFIGRIYAAAIERGNKRQETSNDDFYVKQVPRVFRECGIDEDLQMLRNVAVTMENLPAILKVHQKLVGAIYEKLIDKKKRSFCSKYLHFHCPNAFFIYDSRAYEALAKMQVKLPKTTFDFRSGLVDEEYARFSFRCLALQEFIQEKFPDTLKEPFNPRQIDNLLLEVAS